MKIRMLSKKNVSDANAEFIHLCIAIDMARDHLVDSARAFKDNPEMFESCLMSVKRDLNDINIYAHRLEAYI